MSEIALPAVSVDLDRLTIRRDIIQLAWPVVLQALTRTVMFWTDTLMLRPLGATALAAVAVAGPIAHTLGLILAALGTGALATIARATGAQDPARQEEEAATAIAFGVIGGLVLLVTLAPLYALVGAHLVRVEGSPQATADGIAYLRWIVYATPFMLLESAGVAILRASGDTRTPMFLAIFGNVLNILGNYLLIFGHGGLPAMGVSGAGLATAIAITIESLLTVVAVFSSLSRIRLRRASFARVSSESIRRLLRVSAPAAVEPILLQIGFIIFIRMMAQLGEAGLAAHRVAVTIESLSFMPGWGLSIACGALIGQYLGARRSDKAAVCLGESLRIALVVMTPLGILFALGSTLLARWFLDDPATAHACAWCLRVAAVEQVFMALAMVLGGALRGAGDTKSPIAVGVLGVWGVRLPLSYLVAFGLGLGIVGAWMVMIVDWAVRALAFTWFWRRGGWKAIHL